MIKKMLVALLIGGSSSTWAADVPLDGDRRLADWNPSRTVLSRDEIERCVRKRNGAGEVLSICVSDKYKDGYLRIGLSPGAPYAPSKQLAMLRFNKSVSLDVTDSLRVEEGALIIENFQDVIEKHPAGVGATREIHVTWMDRSGYGHTSTFQAKSFAAAMNFVNEDFADHTFTRRALGLPASERKGKFRDASDKQAESRKVSKAAPGERERQDAEVSRNDFLEADGMLDDLEASGRGSLSQGGGGTLRMNTTQRKVVVVAPPSRRNARVSGDEAEMDEHRMRGAYGMEPVEVETEGPGFWSRVKGWFGSNEDEIDMDLRAMSPQSDDSYAVFEGGGR